MNMYSRLLKLIIPRWRRLALAMFCMSGVAASTAASAYLIKPVLDDIFINRKQDMLMPLAVAVLFLSFFKGVCQCGNLYLMSYVGQRLISDLRQMLYNHIQRLPLSFFDRTPTGALMSRVTSDVNLFQLGVTDAFTGAVKEVLSIVGLLAVVIYRDWQLAMMAILILPIAFFPVIKFGRMLRKITTQGQKNMGSISVVLHETITGNRIVKAFGMEEQEMKRFAVVNQRFLKNNMRSVTVKALNSPIMEFLGGLGIVFVIWYGGMNVINGAATPGNFFSFIAALLLLYDPVKRLNVIIGTVQQGMAAATRTFELLDTPRETADRPGAVEIPPIRDHIEFRDVSFSYGQKTVLSDINLQVRAGEVIALVGMSGAGKSTLVNLIPRFYEVSGGNIFIDGIDTRDATLSSLRGQIALVTQQTILFNDTVRNNIAYGDIRKGEDDIIAAAKAANAYEFIMKAHNGFDTVIGEQGARLSGGERQRICIARALLKDAPILILDEATSSLDSDSELEVQRALENLMVGRTTFVIAHRLSTIKNANRIVALSQGRIVEVGQHEDLLNSNGEYRRLYQLQFSHLQPDEIPAAAGRQS